MARASDVQDLFEISKLTERYSESAEELLDSTLEPISEKVPEEVRKKLGSDFVAFMREEYAKHFTNEEMEEIVKHVRTPAFRKFAMIEISLEKRVTKFLTARISEIVKADLTFGGEEEICIFPHTVN